MIYAEHGTLRYRLINALSWRVASELSRRDAGVYIGLTGYGGSAAHADALMLTSSGGLAEYQARRTGLGFTAGKNCQFKMEWEQAFGMPSARAIAMAMETSLGIHLPEKSPSTTPRALGYRVMASVLEMTVGDRNQWFTYKAEGGPLDPNTASTRDRLHTYEDTRWSLYRDSEPLAVLDNFGWLEIGDRRIDLHGGYRELNGRLYPLVFEVFGSILP
jgi:hypothetical protein